METLFYKLIGSGESIICLHGFALDHTIWLRFAEELKSEVKLILPDLRGHGKSPSPGGSYSMRTMAEDVVRILDFLKIDRAYIAGHSMGGYISLALAENYSDRLLGLALVSSHPFADPPEKKRARIEEIKKLSQSTIEVVLAGMAGKLTKNQEIIDYCRELICSTSQNGAIGALAGMAERPDMVNVMESLNVPPILVSGKDDQFIPEKTIEEMALKLPGLIIKRIDCASHLLMLEEPTETAAALFKDHLTKRGIKKNEVKSIFY